MDRKLERLGCGVLILLACFHLNAPAQWVHSHEAQQEAASLEPKNAVQQIQAGGVPTEVASVNGNGIWISPAEIMALKMSGSAWNNLKAAADHPAGTPNLSNQDDPCNVKVLAKALVYVRTGLEQYRTEVISACMAALGTEKGGRTLALGRELIAYVIAADLVGLPQSEDQRFRAWLRECLTETLDGKTLQSTHEERPNNWGTHAGASRVAAAVYLNDQAEIARCAQVFKGWLGDRASYAGFQYGDLSWQANPNQPVGINHKGAQKGGHSVDGVLPDDQRRGGGFKWPAPKENYVYEALQGALAQAVILSRAGYPVWSWQDRALLRAFQWLHSETNFPASGDDTWEPYIINYYYRTNFPAPTVASTGKNVGWTDWTHPNAGRGTTGVDEPSDELMPATFTLEQNYPNPFTGAVTATQIAFTVAKPEEVRVDLFNMMGQKVRTLFVGVAQAGRNLVQWNGKDNHGALLPSGTYIYKLTSGNQVLAKRLTLSK
ncbi:alginate lyase family protein [candidate division KSB1 bacterium]|nr:alginate lyase family protein [candidate division KSB1 bacterium]